MNNLGSNLYEQQDELRRWLGKQLDALGLGPIETRFRVVLSEPGVTLRGYVGDAVAREGPVVLLIPAPIKRAYLWDLAPGASIVQKCLAGGLRVYLMYWEQPGESERHFGLAEYADRLIRDCLQRIQEETGQPRAFLAAHSLGGTFAAIFAALHPEWVQGLILVGTPLHFGPDVGPLDALVAASPRAQVLTAALGNVPGSLIAGASFMAAPGTLGWERGIDWLQSLPDAAALQTLLRVERWTLDEFRLPQHLFEEVVELLYREDRLMHGTLRVGGKRAAPQQVEAPLLSVIDPRSRIVPPQATLPFHHAVRSADPRVLWYAGDTGVSLQHVGMLVGGNAHQQLWPEILGWIHLHREAG